VTLQELVNFSEAAQLLGVSRPTIYDWIKKGRLHPIRLADRRFLAKSEVLQVKEGR
jgi:excisionase family DNA binding protein